MQPTLNLTLTLTLKLALLLNSVQYSTKYSHMSCAVAPERIWKWGRTPHTSDAKRQKKICRAHPLLALQVQLVVLMSAFMMVSTVWSGSCLLFFYSRCPRAQSFIKVGSTYSPVPNGVGAYVSRRIHTDNVIAPFLLLSVVIVTLPRHCDGLLW